MITLFQKDLKLFLSDKRSVLLTFLLPIILISLFAFAFGGIGGNSSDARPIELLIVNLDETSSSKTIISNLDSLEGLQAINSDITKATELIKKGKYPAALIFHKGFENSIGKGHNDSLELLYDKSREMEIGMLQPVLISTLMRSIGEQSVSQGIESYLKKSFPGIDKRISDQILKDATKGDGFSSTSEMTSGLKMTSIVGEIKEANLGLIQAVAGTSILMLLFSVAGLGASILEEKENGTIKRLLISPLKGSTILYGKMLFTYFIALTQLCVMFLFSWVAFGLDIMKNVPALILMILVTAFAVSSFGIFLAAISKTRQQAQSISTLIILIMSAIGGSMIPLFVMPVIMKKIAVFSVNYWGIQGFYDIFWRALPLSDIMPRIFVLLGIGIVMTLISVALFRKNILKLI